MASARKRRVSDGDEDGQNDNQQRSAPQSLTHPISPPLKKRRLPDTPTEAKYHPPFKSVGSPFQLTKIKDLPAGLNKDTYTLRDVLGDPLISECWEFNYLHDIDFLMSAFDEDVRSLVKVHVVHGFWKREDPNRLALQVGLLLIIHHRVLTNVYMYIIITNYNFMNNISSHYNAFSQDTHTTHI